MSSETFYSSRAREYFGQTFGIDPSSFLRPLTGYLSPGARILDIGCGSGRDMLWLQQKGFTCWGLELSSPLAGLARRHTGLPVIEADFESFDFQKMDMDALILVGALVHVPQARFKPVLARILRALKKSGGHVLITMKKGRGREIGPDGRVFYLWPEGDLIRVFTDCGLVNLQHWIQESAIRRTDTWMGFVLRAGRCNQAGWGSDDAPETFSAPDAGLPL
ncbi:class I SAM-dependent methyltransferase [Desulfovermiculus halophilus]|uniref:class I SAM-dependent methyltransferase n=1 Tax=Desulfovermiculus halophilus TaxID=339722 RepID=UPI0009FFD35C|nr:class I SAM-dependent methyltransferase [Desulfovermiculus halophilus]